MSNPLRLIPLLALLVGCHVSFGGNTLRVDGVDLEESHWETLELESLPEGFHVSSSQGDLVVEHAVGPPSIHVELFEKTPGDAHAVFEDGRLFSRTTSGEPSAIGDVTLHTDGSLASLELQVGLGNVRVSGVAVAGKLSVDLGMGDCQLVKAGQPETIELVSGHGNLEIRQMRCVAVTVESGMGDIALREVNATTAELETGLGDVEVEDSTFEQLTAETGLGDIDCRRSKYGEGRLRSGLGSVRESH